MASSACVAVSARISAIKVMAWETLELVSCDDTFSTKRESDNGNGKYSVNRVHNH